MIYKKSHYYRFWLHFSQILDRLFYYFDDFFKIPTHIACWL